MSQRRSIITQFNADLRSAHATTRAQLGGIVNNDQDSTHWDTCYLEPSHHACALAYINRLEGDLRALKSDMRMVSSEIRKAYDIVSNGELQKLEEFVEEQTEEVRALRERVSAAAKELASDAEGGDANAVPE